MFRKISIKALVISNIVHWITFLTGWILAFTLYGAGATISSDGTASLATVFSEMKSSVGLLIATTLIFFFAPVPAGYIAAKIAPHEKLMNGALSVSAWFMLCAYVAIWGIDGGHSPIHMPRWLDALTTYGIAIPAMFGAYLWHLRSDRLASFSRNTYQNRHEAPVQSEGMTPTLTSSGDQIKRFGRTGSGLGVFIALILQFLLTQHEQTVLLVAMIVALVLVVAIAFTLKAIKRTSS